MDLQPKDIGTASLLSRVRAFRKEVGPLWWYTILTFCAHRIGDIGSLFIGVIYLPSALSREELGAVDPVTRLAGFAAIPMGIISIVGAKYLSTYHARNELGKIKHFIRDMAWLGLISAIVFTVGLVMVFESFRTRLGVGGRFLLPALCAIGVLSCWQPLTGVVMQGVQKFKTVAFLGVANTALKVALVLCLVPLLHLSGLLFATFISGLVLFLLSLWTLRTYMGSAVKSAAYYEEWKGILAFAVPIAAMAVVGNIQNFVEPFVVKHFLPAEDAAGYYMACRFGFIPNYLVGAIGFVLFPLLSHRHERGEDTREYLRQALLVTLLVSSAGTLVLGSLSGRIFDLLPQWRVFAAYAPLVWLVGLQVTLDSVVSIYTTHEMACRRFRFLWVMIPLALLDVAILYGSFGWGGLQPWLPATLWALVDGVLPRTLTYAVAVMCGIRFLVAMGLALNCWMEEERGNRVSRESKNM